MDCGNDSCRGWCDVSAGPLTDSQFCQLRSSRVLPVWGKQVSPPGGGLARGGAERWSGFRQPREWRLSPCGGQDVRNHSAVHSATTVCHLLPGSLWGTEVL